MPRAASCLALVIGCNGAQTSGRQLEAADADATAMATSLPEARWELITPAILTDQAAPENLVRHVRTRSRRATPDDSLLLYYAGHGAPMQVDDREDVDLVSNTCELDEIQVDPDASYATTTARRSMSAARSRQHPCSCT